MEESELSRVRTSAFTFPVAFSPLASPRGPAELRLFQDSNDDSAIYSPSPIGPAARTSFIVMLPRWRRRRSNLEKAQFRRTPRGS
jgi:hypothetical protein